MANITNQYLDLAGLTLYNTQIQDWSNSISQAGIKTVLKTADGNSLKFYKKPSATLSDTADFTIELGSEEAATKLAALATRMGATWNSSTNAYDISLDSSLSATTVVGAINEVISDFNTFIGAIPSGATATTVIGYIAEKVATEIAKLDTVSDVTTASETNGVVTLTAGIAEVDGVIQKGSETDITLAKVATTGKAEDISVEDSAGKLTATDVEAALAELADMAGAQEVYMVDASAGQSDYAKVYKLYQGNGSAVSPVEAELKGTINIPKDKVVQSGSVVTIVFDASDNTLHEGTVSGPDVTDLIIPSGQTATSADAGKYIKLVLQNVTDPLYIAAKALVDIYTGGTTDEATVTIDGNNEITVTINTIAGTKIGYTYSGTTVTETVAAALTRIDGDDSTTGSISKKVKDAIDALDTTSDVAVATYTAGSGSGSGKTADTTVFTGSVKEVNGVIDAGTADTVTFSSIPGASIAGLFS